MLNPMLTLPAPAKLNLFLHITGRRDNGYHELQTVFQFLDYCDELSFRLTEEDVINLPDTMKDVAPTDNLIYKAASKLLPYKKTTQGIEIRINKIIPMGGGLGGGSSDAATTLVAVNHLWQCGLTTEQLAQMGLSLGADVPVFVMGHAAWAEGVGEKLTPISPPESWYLVVTPEAHVSTAKIFSDKRLTRDTPKIKIAPAFEGNAQRYKNDCQAVVCEEYPEVQKALKQLEKFGNALMTGTGACVFSKFETETQARNAQQQLSSNLACFIAKGLNISPLYTRLKKQE
ncbi:MAG: 4-(cytidine 5'-diphospho)-2-C-methyl-D-erythritol kinase [Hahellaceae bacterium]|nr:4-(cytidine 5'-diphospho)-2-C-methyl-D-erythritol kinase [Hahellaceae bacterium]MCP5168881.1 4-(cytidine 5'-diphospho)-2-C-methyl-D-erythritol kinase [Hahellaceae bacterium]